MLCHIMNSNLVYQTRIGLPGEPVRLLPVTFQEKLRPERCQRGAELIQEEEEPRWADGAESRSKYEERLQRVDTVSRPHPTASTVLIWLDEVVKGRSEEEEQEESEKKESKCLETRTGDSE